MLSLESSAEGGEVQDTITFAVNGGETFYLWVYLKAVAKVDSSAIGSYAITRDGLFLAFENDDGLARHSFEKKPNQIKYF